MSRLLTPLSFAAFSWLPFGQSPGFHTVQHVPPPAFPASFSVPPASFPRSFSLDHKDIFSPRIVRFEIVRRGKIVVGITVSNRFVSSRHNVIFRSPSTAASSCSVFSDDGALHKNHRPALFPAILQDFGALFLSGGKTFKAKPSGRKPRHRERRDTCSRTRQARHPDSCFQTHPHEHLARIGDRRRPRIRNQRNILSLL